jgi:hypothetical protein
MFVIKCNDFPDDTAVTAELPPEPQFHVVCTDLPAVQKARLSVRKKGNRIFPFQRPGVPFPATFDVVIFDFIRL